MKDKDSEKTEDGLDQTFGGGDQTFDSFDEEMTNNTEGAAEATSSEVVKKKSGTSSNTMLFIGGGIATVLVAGYVFVVKPMLAPAPQQNVAKNTTPDANLPTVPPVADVKPGTPVVPESPERQVARDFLTGNTPVASATVPSVPTVPTVPSVPVVVASAPSAVIVTPPVILPTVQVPTVTTPTIVTPTVVAVVPDVKAPEVVKENDSSAATIAELGKRFEVQGQQFKIALDDVGTKVSNLEKFRDEQLVTNKNVEQRLSTLEGKKTSTVSQPNSTVKSTTKKWTKTVRNKPVYMKKEAKEVRKDNGNILVDKSEAREMRTKEVIIKDSYSDYNIHSIYGGRVWLKNTDGSLSTYTSGDRLPSGELIKNIDDEKYSIITDKRTFSKK